jgi:hypothetical protein
MTISALYQTLVRDYISHAVMWGALSRAFAGWYVISGGDVSQRGAGANMSVDVAAIGYSLNGVYGSKATTTNVVIDAADPSSPRIDLLYINSSGTLTILKGTARAIKPVGLSDYHKFEEPYPAEFSATSGVPLALIHVGAGVTSITNANIWMIAVVNSL